MSISGNGFVINAENFSKQTIGLPWFSLEFGSDQLLLLKAGQLTPKTIRLDGVVPLSFLVQPADDPAWVVLDLEFLTSPDSLVRIKNLAFGCQFDGDLDAPLGDVLFELLELLGREVWEDLIGRSVVAVDLAHGGSAMAELGASIAPSPEPSVIYRS